MALGPVYSLACKCTQCSGVARAFAPGSHLGEEEKDLPIISSDIFTCYSHG